MVWGGTHPTLLPGQTLENHLVDIIVVGEGDYTFFELVEHLEKEKSLSDVKGLYYKKNNKIKRTPERPFINDLDKLPEYPYKLIDMNAYFGFNLTNRKSFTLETSRGCPYRCAFCYNTVFNKRRWRCFSAEHTIERIKYLVNEFNIKDIFIQDDNICVNLKRFRKIISGLIKENLDIVWGLNGVRIDTISKMDHSFLDDLEKAGCKNIDIGIESGSQRIINLILKGIFIDTILAVNKKLDEHLFKTKYTFMIGIPTETSKERRESVDLALKLNNENKNAYSIFFIYTPYPRTELYKLALKHGFKEPTTLEEWSKLSISHKTVTDLPWVSEYEIREINNIAVLSYAANKNIRFKINKKSTRLFFDIYHPLAKFRFKHNFYRFPVDIELAKKLYVN
jgi:radical SAM superfamily enzyme YgiQ (UPF0313 family)